MNSMTKWLVQLILEAEGRKDGMPVEGVDWSALTKYLLYCL